MKTILLSGVAVLLFAGSAIAHPGHGGGAPPSTVTMGPPSAAFDHVPNGVDNGAVNGHQGIGDAAMLGNLNAAHASTTALAHASPKSVVGKLATYKSQMTTALAHQQAAQSAVNSDNARIAADNAIISNSSSTPAQVSAAQADLTSAQAQLATDQAALAAAQTAVANTEASLSNFANKPVTPSVIARVNVLLGLN